MLSTALNFKIVFSAYKEREPHYNYGPLPRDWEKVHEVYKLLSIFNLATHVISGTEYLTSNLKDLFMRAMTVPMRAKFNKH